jgi:hypothetical protein
LSIARVILCCVVIALLVCVAPSNAASLFKGGEKTPSDAIVLFDGKDLSQWVKNGSSDPAGWKVTKGYAEVVPGSGSIATKQTFKDCQLHVEFWLPLLPNEQGQARANSGVFLQGENYEVQVLDSYGLESGIGDCGAIYSIHAPIVNASRPPEQWQTYDIVYHAPKFDASGKKTANGRMTVFQNGVLIHDDQDVPYPTIDHNRPDATEAGPIVLQDHGHQIRYRNIWIRPL